MRVMAATRAVGGAGTALADAPLHNETGEQQAAAKFDGLSRAASPLARCPRSVSAKLTRARPSNSSLSGGSKFSRHTLATCSSSRRIGKVRCVSSFVFALAAAAPTRRIPASTSWRQPPFTAAMLLHARSTSLTMAVSSTCLRSASHSRSHAPPERHNGNATVLSHNRTNNERTVGSTATDNNSFRATCSRDSIASAFARASGPPRFSRTQRATLRAVELALRPGSYLLRTSATKSMTSALTGATAEVRRRLWSSARNLADSSAISSAKPEQRGLAKRPARRFVVEKVTHKRYLSR